MGAEISAERSDKGIEDDLHKIIGVCDACFKDTANAGQIEEVLNGIVSMLALVTGEKSENLIVAFCEKLTKAPSNIIGMTCLKVLWSLYQSLDTESPMRFHVYHALVILAGRTKHIDTVYKVRNFNPTLTAFTYLCSTTHLSQSPCRVVFDFEMYLNVLLKIPMTIWFILYTYKDFKLHAN